MSCLHARMLRGQRKQKRVDRIKQIRDAKTGLHARGRASNCDAVVARWFRRKGFTIEHIRTRFMGDWFVVRVKTHR